MSKCYIVILNYKRWQDTVECLHSIFKSTYTNFTVLVVDNNSENTSLENIIAGVATIKTTRDGGPVKYIQLTIADLATADVSTFTDLVLIQNDRNAGFAGGNNVALRLLAKEDAYILLLNPDMTITEDTLQELVAYAGQHPRTIIGSVTKNYADPDKLLFYGGGKVNFLSATVSLIKKKKQIKELQYISGGCLFTPASSFQQLGLLPEDYFLYWEETEWCYNASKKGISMAVCLQAVCYDKISTTIGTGFLADYYYTRNGLVFLLKHRKWCLVPAFIAIIFRAAKRLLTGKHAKARGLLNGMTDFLTNRKYENQ